MSSAYLNSPIQPVAITLASGTASNTATINAVGSNAFLVWGGFTTSAAADLLELDTFATMVLTNSTTVTAARTTSTTGTNIYNCSVIDPSSALVTSVQAGTIAITAGTSNTATITSVNTALSAVFFLGSSTLGTTLPTSLCGVTLTNATTVTAKVNTLSTCTVSYVVVTFAAAAITNIQQIANTSTTSSTSDNVSITTVNSSNCLHAWGGYTTASNSFTSGSFMATFTPTIIGNQWVTATTATRTEYSTLIQFASGVLKSNDSNEQPQFQGATTRITSIGAVITNNAVVVYTGMKSNNALSAPNQSYASVVLTNSTTVTGNVNTAVSGPTFNYNMVEFTPSPPSSMFLVM